LRAARRCAVLAFSTLLVVIVQPVLVVLRLPLARRSAMRWHRLFRHAAGLGLRRYGVPETRGPVLFVANHVSYLDIVALGSMLEGSFVAKAEVARWPVIGFLCRLQKTVFVERRAASVGAQIGVLHQRLDAGDNLILFPEGTSSDGNRVLPFKSALFRAAAAHCGGEPVRVQPVTIAYSRFDGLPMGRNLRPYFAWYGDMTLLRHLWTGLGMGRPGVDVVFHPSVTLGDFASHTELAQHCQMQTARSLSDALAGRLAGPQVQNDMAAQEVETETEAEVAPAFSL
jgi:1-acyl-sn-glycerol-3-phosphate acyltransferase